MKIYGKQGLRGIKRQLAKGTGVVDNNRNIMFEFRDLDNQYLMVRSEWDKRNSSTNNSKVVCGLFWIVIPRRLFGYDCLQVKVGLGIYLNSEDLK